MHMSSHHPLPGRTRRSGFEDTWTRQEYRGRWFDRSRHARADKVRDRRTMRRTDDRSWMDVTSW